MKKYDVFIIGVPHLTKLDSYEIDDTVKYIKDGGSLLVINDGGGDYENNKR